MLCLFSFFLRLQVPTRCSQFVVPAAWGGGIATRGAWELEGEGGGHQGGQRDIGIMVTESSALINAGGCFVMKSSCWTDG
jgi:hypothetical protein